jgi:hypothetical protein
MAFFFFQEAGMASYINKNHQTASELFRSLYKDKEEI